MRRTLSIPPAPSQRVIAEPLEIFSSLRPEAEGLAWVLWGETWLTAKHDADLDVLAIEESVEAAAQGVPKDWPSLYRLVENLSQIIDGTFIGTRDVTSIPAYPAATLTEVHDGQELVVTADDSTYWWVTGPTNVIERLAVAFPHATESPGFH